MLFVDAFLNLVRDDLRGLGWLFDLLEKVSEQHGVRLVISCSGAPETRRNLCKNTSSDGAAGRTQNFFKKNRSGCFNGGAGW